MHVHSKGSVFDPGHVTRTAMLEKKGLVQDLHKVCFPGYPCGDETNSL